MMRRKQRIEATKKALSELKRVSYNYFIARLCIDNGFSRKTAEEYINILVDEKSIVIEADLIEKQMVETIVWVEKDDHSIR